MSPISTSKRRRLNNATNTLSQPFKSPFKTPLKQNPATVTSSPSANEAPLTSSPSLPNPLINNNLITSQAFPPKPQPQPPSTKTPRPPLQSDHHHHHQPSTHLMALQSKHTALLSRLSTSRAALETSTQALNIESSNRDAELELLIKKWRVKSREAAEMVFVGVKERVDRAGGVKGLKTRERERGGGGSGGWGWGWDEVGRDEGGREGCEEDGEGEGGEERDVGEEEYEEGEEEEEEEGEYTMDMMLKSLNIDLGVIGFDKKAQKWVD